MTFERIAQSFRTLKRHKAFVATAVSCLGLAIALNTTMYSVMDAVINPRIDVPHPEQLVSVGYFGDFRQQISMKDKNDALLNASFHQGVVGTRGSMNDRIVERGPRLREVLTLSITPNYFAVVGARPAAGRLINEADLGAGERPIVMTERLWKQLFPEADEFTPTKVIVGGAGRQIVGLLSHTASSFPRGADIWQLLLPEELANQPWTLARMKPGLTIDQAGAEMNGVSQRFRDVTREGVEAGWLVRPVYKKEIATLNFHYSLIGSVVAVLLIACANLANLQLARGVSRARELATRAAVGASRSDIVWQLVLESAWLAAGGLVLGAVLTALGIDLIDKFVPRSIAEYMTYPQVSWRVAAFAVVATLVCLTLVGLLPAVRLSRVDINTLLQSGAGTGKTVSARRQYGTLVVVEVSLALMLLCSTGLLVRAAIVVNRFSVPYEQRQKVDGWLGVRPLTPTERLTMREWSARIIQHGLTADSITDVATGVYTGPVRRKLSIYDNSGQPVVKDAVMWGYSTVSPNYFRVSRTPIIAGRDFALGEFAQPYVIVDSVAARVLWPGMSAVGQQIKFGPPEWKGPWYEVIGVAGTSRTAYFQADQDAVAEMRRYQATQRTPYMRGGVWVLNAMDTALVLPPQGRNRFGGATFGVIARGKGDPRRFALRLRNKFAEMGPGIYTSYPRTWEETTGIARYKDRQDFMAMLFTVFAISALALAALGVYAIIAHMVAQRTREFGVRIAVGAGERDIRQMVIREGNILTLLGIAIGLVITYKTAAWVRAFVFSDWDRYDSRVFAVVALVLFATAWLASYLPARRAMRINPVEALRND